MALEKRELLQSSLWGEIPSSSQHQLHHSDDKEKEEVWFTSVTVQDFLTQVTKLLSSQSGLRRSQTVMLAMPRTKLRTVRQPKGTSVKKSCIWQP